MSQTHRVELITEQNRTNLKT